MDDGGVYCSKVRIALLVTGAALVAALVGVIVHFTGASVAVLTDTASKDGGGNPANTLDKKLTIADPLQGIEPPQPKKPLEITRLSDDVVPYHYNLVLRPDFYDGEPPFNLTGQVEIFMRARKNVRNIVLHAANLELDEVESIEDLHSGTDITVVSVNRNTGAQLLTFALHTSLQAGLEYKLSVAYKAEIKSDLKGLFWMKYRKTNNATEYMLASQLQPMWARKVFPCFDEPKFKSTFNISIYSMAPYKALSNMPQHSLISHDNNWRLHRFETTPIMSTYILVFTVNKYAAALRQVTFPSQRQIDLYYWAPSEKVDALAYAQELGGPMLLYFSNYFNLSYTLPKLGMIALPELDTFSAMENWGLITYVEHGLLWDANHYTTSHKEWMANLIGHELAHKWVGNLVTCQWWDELWLNEGFARHYQRYAVMDKFKNWDLESVFVAKRMRNVMMKDATYNTHAVVRPVQIYSYSVMKTIFTQIVYDKGACLIRMMRGITGEDLLKITMRQYLQANKYKMASGKTFFNAYQKVLDSHNFTLPNRMENIMSGWLTQDGFPLVTVKTEDNKVSFSQKRFIVNPKHEAREGENKLRPIWSVPIPYVTSSNRTLTWTWLTGETATVTRPFDASSNDTWFLANVGHHGYYRVNYDRRNWFALAKQLRDDHTQIRAASRAQLIGDASLVSWAGEVTADVPLAMTQYLHRETDYIAWIAADHTFNQLMLMFGEHKELWRIHKYVTSKIANLYTSVGWIETTGEELLTTYLRSTILNLACQCGVPECLNTVRQKYQEMMSHNRNVPPDLRLIVYSWGVYLGSQPEWDFAYRMYQQSTVSVEKARWIEAMANTRDPHLIARYIHKVRKREIRPQELSRAISAIARNIRAFPILWRLMLQNKLPAYTVALRQMGIIMSTEFELALVSNSISRISTNDRKSNYWFYKSILNEIKGNILWRNNNEQIVFDWLKANT